ncbi:MAG: DUF4406 domain-containing protein [Candidatus Taylorbacteria bacterium]|nr:DUF4406 domain-containing protein [Candidatus Taylorbacteria bacterium]
MQRKRMDEYFWTKDDFEKVNRATTMPELLAIALDILGRMPDPVSLVTGPITTGGKGSVSENMEVFKVYISKLQKEGRTVFNQLPFEHAFSELAKKSALEYYTPILDDFFLPLFKSGKISEMCFIPGWESSTGARWESGVADELGIKKAFLQ